jgi:hypothetical protein
VLAPLTLVLEDLLYLPALPADFLARITLSLSDFTHATYFSKGQTGFCRTTPFLLLKRRIVLNIHYFFFFEPILLGPPALVHLTPQPEA